MLVALIEPYLQSDSLAFRLLNPSLRAEILQNGNVCSSSGFQRQLAAYSSRQQRWVTFPFLVHTATTLRMIPHCMAPTWCSFSFSNFVSLKVIHLAAGSKSMADQAA